MNYCIYNKELDQYLSLIHFYNDNDFPSQTMKWSDEFESIIPDPDKVEAFLNPTIPPISRVLLKVNGI